MRISIVIDETLMREALKATGLQTKREVVDLGLRTLLQLQQQKEILKFRGRLHWDGDLDVMRTDAE
ncbi:type II toxin-antitoxin system VapB family antitoxin [Brevundimonas sp. R86498]|uniref:type II toxin-antitoxin system VapB family antitoxin n=1 Tax=Brevundimonas sp. R86498 TaxID=3093845 RepID=UPI0037C9AFC9